MKDVHIKKPESHLSPVYAVADSVQAELIKNMLVNHGIEASVSGEYQAGFTGVLAVEIIVLEPDKDKHFDLSRNTSQKLDRTIRT